MTFTERLLGSTGFRISTLALANIAIGVMVYLSSLFFPSTSVARIEMDHKSRLGQQVWQRKNCISCHSIYGLGGHLGPDLTQIIERKGPAFTQAYILAGGYKMPPQTLTQLELDQLISYLSFLSDSGTYPIKGFPRNAYGEFDDE